MNNTVVNQELAKRILSSRIVVNTPGKVENVKITNISEEVFNWENSNDEYVIANTNLMNTYLQKEAQELYKQGKYQEACNKNLTVRLSLKEAEKLMKGDIVRLLVDEVELKDGSTALMIKTGSLSAMPSVKTSKFSFEDVVEEVEDLVFEA